MSRRQKTVIDSSIPPAGLPLRPSVRFRLAKNDTFFGPGVAEFLILVDQSNSMQTACKEMEMSYSKGWKMISVMEEELGDKATVIATGGIARFILPLCRREIQYDKNLILKGLAHIYQDNTKLSQPQSEE